MARNLVAVGLVLLVTLGLVTASDVTEGEAPQPGSGVDSARSPEVGQGIVSHIGTTKAVEESPERLLGVPNGIEEWPKSAKLAEALSDENSGPQRGEDDREVESGDILDRGIEPVMRAVFKPQRARVREQGFSTNTPDFAMFPTRKYKEMSKCNQYSRCAGSFMVEVERQGVEMLGKTWKGVTVDEAIAREALCAECIEFLCCEARPRYTLTSTWEATKRAKCQNQCLPLVADMPTLNTFQGKETVPLMMKYSYFGEYIRALTRSDINLYLLDSFKTFRSIPYILNNGPDTELSHYLRGLQESDFKEIDRSHNARIYLVEFKRRKYVVKRPIVHGTEITSEIAAEIGANQLLRHSKNPHITKYYGYYVHYDNPDNGMYISLVYEYVPGGDLGALWRKDDYKLAKQIRGRPDIVLDLVAQMVVSLRVLGVNRIAHRDLKLENFFVAWPVDVDKELEIGDILIKLGDFDRARMWAKSGSEQSPLDSNMRAERTIWEMDSEGIVTDPLPTSKIYPTDLSTIRACLMPPEAMVANLAGGVSEEAFGRLFDQNLYEDALDVIHADVLAAASFYKGWNNSPTKLLYLRARLMDGKVLSSYDMWQLGVMALQLVTGSEDPMIEVARSVSDLEAAEGRLQEGAGGKKELLCREGSTLVEAVACFLHLEDRVMWSAKSRAAIDKQILHTGRSRKKLTPLLVDLLKFDPSERLTLADASKHISLVDAVSDVDEADRYIAWDTPREFNEEPSKAAADHIPTTTMGRPEKTLSWETCSALSYSVSSESSPVKRISRRRPSPSLSTHRSLRSISPSSSMSSLQDDDTTERLSGELGSLDDHGGLSSQESGKLRSTSDSFLSPAADDVYASNDMSPYASGFYFLRKTWTEEAPPIVYPTDGSRIRSDLEQDSKALQDVVGRSVTDGMGQMFPEASYAIAPGHGSEDDALEFSDVSVRSVSIVDSAAMIYEMFGSPSSRPNLPGGDMLIVNVDISFEYTGTKHIQTDVRLEAYDKYSVKVAGVLPGVWFDSCTSKPVATSWLGASRECRSTGDGPHTKVRVPMLVYSRQVGPWDLQLNTRVSGSSRERCLRVRIPSPLNVFDVRWDTSASRKAMRTFKSETCDVCYGALATMVHSMMYKDLDDSYFVIDPVEACGQTNREFCNPLQQELFQTIYNIPRKERSLLLGVGPYEGCNIITGGKCNHRVPSKAQGLYTPRTGTMTCVKAKMDLSQDRGYSLEDADGGKGLDEFPKCPYGFGIDDGMHPNVLPALAPSRVYQEWHQENGCGVCRHVVSSLKKSDVLDEKAICSNYLAKLKMLGRTVRYNYRRIWHSHSIARTSSHFRMYDGGPAALAANMGQLAQKAEGAVCESPWEERMVQLCYGIVTELKILSREEREEALGSDYCSEMSCC